MEEGREMRENGLQMYRRTENDAGCCVNKKNEGKLEGEKSFFGQQHSVEPN